ncbi:MAG TPA: glutamyl-tRNA reductase [Gemmatimonadaceae bacterium]|nr:glutamyl-tRNA reductase [Gemmatimonadaceae bacterium]
MPVIVAGISHRGAPVAIREKIAYRPVELVPTLAALRDRSGAREGVLLSTCNRTELYLVEGAGDALPFIWAELSARLGEEASAYGYVRRDREAVAHLFRVAAGLDSMILGEAQIHGQVRDAWSACRSQSGTVLNRLFQTSLQVAGRIRADTAIARGAASVSTAALQLARQIFGSLTGRRAMVLGAGEMAELALECLAAEGVRTAVVANRTFERAVALAARYGATAMHYEQCWEQLAGVDVLLCSTAAPHPVVTADHVRAAVERRRHQPLCILDIAMPRDVDPAVRQLENVYLYDLDDLHAVVATNLERRRAELPAVETVIAAEVERFWQWLAGLAAVPVLTRFRGEMERVRQQELQEALHRLGALPPEQRAVVEQLSRSLMNKFLHGPTVRLRAAAANGRGLGVIDALRYLFDLADSPTRDDEPVLPPAAEAARTTDDAQQGEP